MTGDADRARAPIINKINDLIAVWPMLKARPFLPGIASESQAPA